MNTTPDIIDFLLIEGRLEDVKRKYEGKIDEEIIDHLSESDPSGNNKYLDWMVKNLEGDNTMMGYVISMVNSFENALPRLKIKDINAYRSVDELEDALSVAIKKPIIKTPEEKIYEDDKYIIYQPQSKETSCEYGSGARWCIAANGSGNQYDNYVYNKNQDPYFLISKEKKSPWNKIAIMFKQGVNEPVAIYDVNDILVASDGSSHPASGIDIMADTTIEFLRLFIGSKDFEKIYSILSKTHELDSFKANREKRKSIPSNIAGLKNILRYLNNVDNQNSVTGEPLITLLRKIDRENRTRPNHPSDLDEETANSNRIRFLQAALRICEQGSPGDFYTFLFSAIEISFRNRIFHALKPQFEKIIKRWGYFLSKKENFGISLKILYTPDLFGNRDFLNMFKKFGVFDDAIDENGLCTIPPGYLIQNYSGIARLTELNPKAFVVLRPESNNIIDLYTKYGNVGLSSHGNFIYDESSEEMIMAKNSKIFGVNFVALVQREGFESVDDFYEPEIYELQLNRFSYIDAYVGYGYGDQNDIYSVRDLSFRLNREISITKENDYSVKLFSIYSKKPTFFYCYPGIADEVLWSYGPRPSLEDKDLGTFKEIYDNSGTLLVTDIEKNLESVEELAKFLVNSRDLNESVVNEVARFKRPLWNLKFKKYDDEVAQEILKFLDNQEREMLQEITEKTILRKLLG